ncbi:T9SS type B sorting domain-containing protein [Deminuibacter soli]|uniref:Gliding motility-associated C-terminal domain-containing protein n=1 Tax=Deminuibacter soli TaxID=2291815 RepID=A0A3E1NLF4_9BACT|nr:gliding motility-associated C-terminal domain-containing protein [Deminuibacter soli]RFM28770.1 hypothetical protein DXN05_08300 [Deminuibacter soli]
MKAIVAIFFLLVPLWGAAQLCQGSLGDPVVNTTFGAGTGPGAPLRAATIYYKYTGSPCPEDGMYTLTHSIPTCFKDTWHSLTSDHTGNPNGYFLVINGSLQPGDFYLDTIRGLCANTTYEFAAWMMNLLKVTNKIHPNITFSIERTDGTVLQQYHTGELPMLTRPQWKQYGFYFTTQPDAPDVVLRMTDNAPGGQGNDIALDDITFRPCGASLQISINGSTSGNNAGFCNGRDTSFTLNSSVSGSNGSLVYQWQQFNAAANEWTDLPQATGTQLQPQFTHASPACDYRYRLSAALPVNISRAACRVVSNVNSIAVHALPAAQPGSNSPLCTGNTLQLTAINTSEKVWQGPAGFTGTGNALGITGVQLANAGWYKVTTTDSNHCTAHDSVNVLIDEMPVAVAGRDTAVCQGTAVQLHGSGKGAFLWTPKNGLSASTIANPRAVPDSTQHYILSVTNGHCTDTAGTTIQVYQKPIADVGQDITMFEGDTASLHAQVWGTNVSWQWNPLVAIDNPQSLQPVVHPAADTSYTLTVHSNEGCGTAYDAVFVRVYKKVHIPNTFSPNGDNINDDWRIQELATYPEAVLTVFNRYGQAVYNSKGYNKPWNGTYNGQPLPVGTYYYVIDLKNKTQKLTGWVMILK